ncbi:hypothetical protein [Tenggerimyces flavus]|uniref:Uncharacterized protein n=1 Tax=Tenggerimyces flavus TaxID=1708749 RepID=A0ABV7YAC5_9ACTN|nr:hypothetical protein [Tenggerimyces flavus]MBM7785371.1 hypothetical protein [Tenggerimyces flavus]
MIEFLARAVDSYAPYLQEDGELHDPVFGEPTQYGTAYHAYCNAVLARLGIDRDAHTDRAARGLAAALAHTGDPTRTPAASGFDRATGKVTRGNHRDFTWPPILKTFLLLRAMRHPRTDEFAKQIAEVDVPDTFRARPPSNWAAVWLSGEWLRIREGLSPHTVDDLDAWLGVFFEELVDVERGFYLEPGKPNSYDLFTRFHLADLVIEGYDGRFRTHLHRLFETGLDRSRAVQLSDGSLASAHRSAGQTWTLGAQVVYFTLAATHFAGADDTPRYEQAREGASRAWAAFQQNERPEGPFSPVENVLPPAYRVGYERYTADAHYANLALAFVAGAIVNGFEETPLEQRASTVQTEDAPIFRGVAHHGSYSIALNGDPAETYDAFGITDVTFGPGRVLQFASSARHQETGAFVNLGLALRTDPGRAELDILCQRKTTPITPTATESGIRLDTIQATLENDGIEIEESVPGHQGYRTLLVPYLRDRGTSTHTRVERTDQGIDLIHGDERIGIEVEGELEYVLDLPHGWENRRGLCGLVRIDLKGRGDSVRYRLTART